MKLETEKGHLQQKKMSLHRHSSVRNWVGRKICNKFCCFSIFQTTCYCHPGYHGNLCQFNQTTCEEFPCQATGSICKEREMSDVLFPSNDQQFVCICPPGFEGSNCEININECFEKPCKNGVLNPL